MTSVSTWRLIWNGQVIECPQCRAYDRWELHSDDGRAWAVCDEGHETDHPLVYPEVVELVSSWAPRVAAGAHGEWFDAFWKWQTTSKWQPHWRDIPGAYHPWDVDNDVDWSEWPQLIEGKRLREEVLRWSNSHEHSDMSFYWDSAWGTTDPDKTIIELMPPAGPDRGQTRFERFEEATGHTIGVSTNRNADGEVTGWTATAIPKDQ